MINADGAGTAPAVNTDAHLADPAQGLDERLDAFLSTDEAETEQAVDPAGSDQAQRQQNTAEDPENLFGQPDENADPENSEGAKAAPVAEFTLPDGTKATTEQIQEWRDAGLRTADYTRKTQEVAQQRVAVEQHHTAVANALERALAVVEAYVPQPPSTELAIQDPARYTQEMAIYQAAMGHVEEITRQREQLAAQANQRNQTQRGEFIQAERDRLFAAIPELKDGAKRQAFNQEMMKAVEVYGFSPADYNQIMDHRLIRVLADAARYQRIKAASAQGKPRPDNGTAPAAPGRRAPAQPGNEIGSALAQAKRSGSKADSARAIDAWLAAD